MFPNKTFIIVSDHGGVISGGHFHYSDNTRYTVELVHSTGMPFLMKQQRNFELESIDSTPSISVSSNLSAPFLSTGIINVDQILEVANVPLHV